MNRLERKLNNTLEAMNRTMISPNLSQPRRSYIMKVLESHYHRLNERYVKQFRVDYNPARRGNMCYND